MRMKYVKIRLLIQHHRSSCIMSSLFYSVFKFCAPHYLTKNLQTSARRLGDDLSEKRKGHLPKKDTVEGEFDFTSTTSTDCFDLPSPDLLTTLFDGVPFSQLPIVYIKSTRNNTKITLSQQPNKTIVKSAGTEGFKNCRKGTTVAAQTVANRILSLIRDYDIDKIRLVFNGLGPGRNVAFKVFEASGVKIVSLSDRTLAIEPWIHRPRKPKRL